jgi:hypothetical protein
MQQLTDREAIQSDPSGAVIGGPLSIKSSATNDRGCCGGTASLREYR